MLVRIDNCTKYRALYSWIVPLGLDVNVNICVYSSSVLESDLNRKHNESIIVSKTMDSNTSSLATLRKSLLVSSYNGARVTLIYCS